MKVMVPPPRSKVPAAAALMASELVALGFVEVERQRAAGIEAGGRVGGGVGGEVTVVVVAAVELVCDRAAVTPV